MLRTIYLSVFFAAVFFASKSSAQTIPTPKEHFGFDIGDDYKLANFTQTEAYLKKIAAASDRVKLEDIGLTEEGRHQFGRVLLALRLRPAWSSDIWKEILQ